MNAQNLQSSVECAGQLELLVKDRNHQVGAHRDPDLCLHCVGTRLIEMLDAQMSFDPTEEQLDTPPHLVKHGHSKSWDFQVVGQEDEFSGSFRIVEFDPSQEGSERLPRFFECRFSNMVAAQAGEPVHRHRVMSCEFQVALCSRDKECSSVCYQSEPGKVHVATVDQIEYTRLEEKAVEPTHVVLPRCGNVDASRDWAAQIDLSMELDACLGLPEVGPRKQSQGEIDSSRIQCIDRIVQVQSEIFSGIERSRLAYENLGEALPKTPVSLLVGIGECGFRHRLTEAKMMESGRTCVETGGNIPEAFPPGQLREDHADELLSATKVTDTRLGIVTFDHAMAILPAIDIACKEAGISCRAATSRGTVPVLDCSLQQSSFNGAVLDYIKKTAPDGLSLIILAAYWERYLKNEPTQNDQFRQILCRTVQEIQTAGCRVVILIDVPRFPFDPPKAIALREWLGVSSNDLVIDSAQYMTDTARQRPILCDLAYLGVTIIDPAGFFTDSKGMIHPADFGGVLYWDKDHLSPHGSLRLAEVIAELISNNLRKKLDANNS